MELLKNNEKTKEYTNEIKGLYETRKGQWILTFAPTDGPNNSCRESFLEATQGQIKTAEAQIAVQMPSDAPVRISVKDIPHEISYDKAVHTINQLGCGTVKSAIKNWHRGTDVYNGYIAFIIEGFKKERLPDYVVFKGLKCKTYLPKELYIPKCGRCLQSGHTSIDCNNEPVCRYCRQAGHLQKDCQTKARDFPAIGNYTKTWTFPKQRRTQPIIPTNSPSKTKQNNGNTKQNRPVITPNQVNCQSTEEITPTKNKQETTQGGKDKSISEFSPSASELREISDWSECEDVGNTTSPSQTPQKDAQLGESPKDAQPGNTHQTPKQPEPSRKLKQTSTIGNTPFHPPPKGKAYVKVMVHKYEAHDTTTSLFSDVPDEILSAPAVLGNNEHIVDLTDANLDNSDLNNKRNRESSSESSFSATTETKLTGKNKKGKRKAR
uniref:uncharacterized protein LOC120333297 n=1 Tax=Styela clava TaxID=7725 RepID=UPI0019398E4B|nr:uncharacterized protein LOC120333297 [Styela clava]